MANRLLGEIEKSPEELAQAFVTALTPRFKELTREVQTLVLGRLMKITKPLPLPSLDPPDPDPAKEVLDALAQAAEPKAKED